MGESVGTQSGLYPAHVKLGTKSEKTASVRMLTIVVLTVLATTNVWWVSSWGPARIQRETTNVVACQGPTPTQVMVVRSVWTVTATLTE